MKCPHDATELTKRIYEADIEIDECSQCHGIWLEKGELEQIQETVQKDHREELKKIPNRAVKAYQLAREERGSEPLHCPHCDVPMHAKEYGYCSQIEVDVCIECQGIWLERGELQALEVFFERARSETSDIRKSFWSTLNDFIFQGIVPD